ncbi:hypothetical protein PIB30_010025 [Stylosanthes scabra]|uniref:Uncharacterized protein n=1 Tax=Stylosanthes scabra TaxID=79078 RepID=A0ABU6V4F8_9FABA|nr:hypothetical protein [Stylosanthes scabra]
MRFSPGKEPRHDIHRRGHNLEGGLLFGERRDDDDDLALFNEMESKENFLLQPSDDLLEGPFSMQLRHFSDTKLSVSSHGQGETSDLLNVDDDKNDYEWLFTPPDTPLFPSLDDEPHEVISRGRPQSKPISISRSSTIEKSYVSSRSSASPNSLSLSPRSRSNTLQSRGKLSSVPNSSPWHATPPRKPSTTAHKFSTPTQRKTSTGSNSPAISSGIRGVSPVKTTAYVRGSSPASRNGRDSTRKFSRQSMSPTASWSTSSFLSQDGDQFSSHSKGSVASSGDDDVDSLQSIQVGSLDRPISIRGGSPSNVKYPTSKKSSRMLSTNSAPKRSFDSVLQQMDRKSHQKMFRPLLSSVPSTTFHAGKANSEQCSLVYRDSSATSSNVSSDHGKSFASDTNGSDHNQDDRVKGTEKILYSDIHEEIFSFDEVDILNENIGCVINDGSVDLLRNEIICHKINLDPAESDYSNHHDIDTELNVTSKTSDVRGDISEPGCFENIATCSSCGCRYEVTEQAEKYIKLCAECSRENTLLRDNIAETNLEVPKDFLVISTNFPAEQEPLAERDLQPILSELPQETDAGNMRVLLDEQDAKETQSSSSEVIQGHLQQGPTPSSSVEESAQMNSCQLEEDHSGIDYKKPDNHPSDQELYHSQDRQNLKVNHLLEGTGISVLLRRSKSSKGTIVQGRTFTAASLSYDDLSVARGNVNGMRRSIGYHSYSASSSVDCSPAKLSEFHVQRQSTSRKLDVDCRSDTRIKCASTASSISGTSSHSHHGFGFMVPETSINTGCGILEDKPKDVCEIQASEDAPAYVIDASIVPNFVEEDKLAKHDFSRVNASDTEMLSQLIGVQSDYGDCISYDNVEDHSDHASSISNTEASVRDPMSSFDEKNGVKNTNVDTMDALVSTNNSEITESEIEGENCCQNDSDMTDGNLSLVSKSTVDDSQDHPVRHSSNDCPRDSVSELNSTEYSHGIEGSTITVECQGAGNARSITLEEATDTILFCSSMIHDLAYQAAIIAMEKEHSEAMEKEHSDPLEGSEPTVTILGKANSDKKNSRNRTKPQKVKPTPMETDVKSPSDNKIENDENLHKSLPHIIGVPDKVDGLKPPPNKLESKCHCIIM